MKKIRVKDKEFEVFIPREKIDEAVSRIAGRINEDMKDRQPVFLVVLNGAFMFAADLFKKFNMPCEVSFVKLASYSGTATSSSVKELIGLNSSLKGRQVVIVEDIIDTGITMDWLIGKLYELGAVQIVGRRHADSSLSQQPPQTTLTPTSRAAARIAVSPALARPIAGVEHHHLEGDADLRSRQPDARSQVHRFDHVLDQTGDGLHSRSYVTPLVYDDFLEVLSADMVP